VREIQQDLINALDVALKHCVLRMPDVQNYGRSFYFPDKAADLGMGVEVCCSSKLLPYSQWLPRTCGWSEITMFWDWKL
jgi:hypothetical protein